MSFESRRVLRKKTKNKTFYNLENLFYFILFLLVFITPFLLHFKGDYRIFSNYDYLMKI